VTTTDARTIKSSVSPNKKITWITLLLLPLLIGLGSWQLQRADEKRKLERAWQTMQSEPVIEVTASNLQQLPDYQRVWVQGVFLSEPIWLLDNKQRHGRVGYEVINVFLMDSGEHLLINRGWQPATANRGDLSHDPIDTRAVRLFGELMTASHHPLLIGTPLADTSTSIALAIDPAAMSEASSIDLSARYLRLDDTSAAALVTEWPISATSSNKHLGYAVQWFAMAIALSVWFVVANTRWFRRTAITPDSRDLS